jgi:hypothetical protein
MLPFERFTYPAEKALTAAQQEAEVSRRGYIGTGNLRPGLRRRTRPA